MQGKPLQDILKELQHSHICCGKSNILPIPGATQLYLYYIYNCSKFQYRVLAPNNETVNENMHIPFIFYGLYN